MIVTVINVVVSLNVLLITPSPYQQVRGASCSVRANFRNQGRQLKKITSYTLQLLHDQSKNLEL